MVARGHDGIHAWVGATDDRDHGHDSGAVYHFIHDGQVWQLQQKLHAPDPREDDQFGSSIALARDMLLVGSPGQYPIDDHSYSSGKVYVYKWDDAHWMFEEQLVPWLPPNSQRFGAALAVQSNEGTLRHKLLIGAPTCAQQGNEAGAVYAFEYDGRDWLPRQVMLPPEYSSRTRFGHAIALEQEGLALIGAPSSRVDHDSIGFVFAFRHNGVDWLPWQILMPKSGRQHHFGLSTSISSPNAFIGSGSSFAWYFRFDGDSWQEEQVFTAPFLSISLLGPAVAVGESLAAITGVTASNGVPSARVFKLDHDTWRPHREIRPHLAGRSSSFGFAVSFSDDQLAIGEPSGSPQAVWAFDNNRMRIGDFDLDGILSKVDLQRGLDCYLGPNTMQTAVLPFACTATFDFDSDGDVDLADFAAFQRAFGCGE